MCNIIYSITLLYRYLYKRSLIISFIFILIIVFLIFQEIFFQYFLNINDSNLSIYIKKDIPYRSEDMLNNKFCNDVKYISVLNKHLININKLRKELIIYNAVVLHGDLLNRILINNSKSIDCTEIGFLAQQYPILKNLRAGQTLLWSVIANHNLKFLIWEYSPQEIRIYNRVRNIFSEGIIRIVHYQSKNGWSNNGILFIGVLNGTFIDSVRSLGIEENFIADIINAFRHQLDFRKLHQGDKFAILTSVTINDDYSVRTKLIGARLCTSGKDYYIFRANNGKFYDHKAVRLGENFIRYPIMRPFRISSNFNLRRLNPITRQISPHAGVDFAVPIGTPVLSVGDGEVIISAYSKIAGNYVVIRHSYQCITRYMHLNKSLVKSGQKVRCGDNIALSGNTGRTTGPHLHFEIWVDRRPVDPLIVNFLSIKKSSESDRVACLNQIKKFLPQLRFD